MTSISDPEEHAFLTKGRRTGKLAYLGSTGRRSSPPTKVIAYFNMTG